MNLYCDYKNIYKFRSDGMTMKIPIVDDGCELIITGTHISEFEDDTLFLTKNKDFSFVDKSFDKKIQFYCVPFVDIFGYDKNGFYATLNDFTSESCDSEIVCIDNSLNVYFVSENFSTFLDTLLNGVLTKTKCKNSILKVYNSYSTAREFVNFYEML